MSFLRVRGGEEVRSKRAATECNAMGSLGSSSSKKESKQMLEVF